MSANNRRFRNNSKNYVPNFARHGPSNQKYKPTQPVASVPNPHLLNMNHFGSKVVTCRNVHPSEAAYDEVCNKITNDSFVVENLVEICNPFLQKAYQLKKEEKRALYGNRVHEKLLFHGTKKQYVNNICTFNFDWRLFGYRTGHKFGQGVSFSPNAMYASNYSDVDNYHKVMIVAKVLIARTCQGHKDMDVPPSGFDTSQKQGGAVIVKYEDNEFLPLYKLYYHIEEESEEESDEDDYYDDDDDSSDDGYNYNYYYH